MSIDITACGRYFQDNLGVIIPSSDIDWLIIPESRLLELTSGEVFFDGTGELTNLREFYKLPSLSKEIGSILESCYLDSDIKSVIGKLEKICTLLIEHQNTIDGMVKVEIRPSNLFRGFWNIDFQHIANQIYNSIEGELKSIPLYGAVDQWVTNQDFLLDSHKMRLLSVIYK